MIRSCCLLAVLLLCLCPGEGVSAPEPRVARCFSAEERPDGLLVTNRMPWPGASESLSWLLIPVGSPDVGADGTSVPRIRVPVDRVVVTSMPVVACMESLGVLDRLVGIGGGKYCFSDAVKALHPVEVGPAEGMGAAFDVERLLSLSPDVVFAYAYTSEEREGFRRLEALGIPVVLASEFLEETPLGRAEWVRFFALFLGRRDEAARLFGDVERRYGEIRRVLAAVDRRPTVTVGFPFAGAWQVMGGGSWISLLIEDAGGTYIWKDLPGRAVVPMEAEAIFAAGSDADFWIHCGHVRSRAQALQEEPRVELFRAFREDAVWNNDARSYPGGGNDFYEGGALRPDRVLEDLGIILHPELFPKECPFYYRRLPQEDRP